MKQLYELIGALVRWVLSGFTNYDIIIYEDKKNFIATTVFLVMLFLVIKLTFY